MEEVLETYKFQLEDIVRSGITLISNEKPSEWAERNIIMGKPFPGPLRYSRTPYTRPIIDCFHPSHPMKWLAVKKGAQIGLSGSFIIPVCCWIIACNPGNTYFTVADNTLVEKATEKLDFAITNAGLRDYIRPQIQRRRNTKTGDTNSKKEFSGGYIYLTDVNNHKAIRDVSLKYGLFDDWEAVKKSSKKSGNSRKLLEQRFAAYADSHKIAYISTPEIEEGSNIDAAYELGDKRKWFIPCPCCGVLITLEWECESKLDPEKKAGVTWQLTETGKVIQESVGYICQECGDFFDDKTKDEFLNLGKDIATAEPSKPGYYSFHISSLYAPLGMYDWYHYACDYVEANPPGQPRKEDLHQAFVNLCLGENYTPSEESPSGTDLQNNQRNYIIGTVPEKLSIKDGNGKIVLLSAAFDLNGVVDDARVDYEIVAFSENEATYSITHGSIGTFIPNQSAADKSKDDRPKWTYEHNKPNSVWPEVDKILSSQFVRDTDGKKMGLFISGVDTGHYNVFAYPFVDSKGPLVLSLKGDKENKYIAYGVNVANFKKGHENAKLYMVQVGLLKDKLFSYMKLRCNEGEQQQPGFMNFPIPSDGKYMLKNYFSHFEAEHKVVEKKDDQNISFMWKKKISNAQNHFWDCRVYNLALKDILVSIVGKDRKEQNFTWQDYVNLILNRK